MATVLRNGAVFLHVPKTGGSWISKTLYSLDLVTREVGCHKHIDVQHLLHDAILSGPFHHTSYLLMRRLKKLCGVETRKPFIFSFVRHPLTWYESWFKYQYGQNWKTFGNLTDPMQWHPNAILNGIRSDDFNDFVRQVVEVRPGYVSELYSLYTTPGVVNFVGRQENLRHDLATVLEMLGIAFDPRLVFESAPENVSKADRPEINWDPDLKKKILALEQPAIVAYGY